MTRRFLALAATLPFLTTCCDSAYRIEQGEILLRYRSKDDSLLVLEVEQGIGGTADKAADALQDALKGHRLYPPEGGFISLDFDKPHTVEPGEEQEHADFLELARSVHVVDARVFLDDQGRLSFLRLTRIANFHRVLELVNAWTNRENAGVYDTARPFEPRYPVFDEQTRDAFRAASASGHAWLHVEGEALVLDVPMTPTNAAQCLAWLTKEARREGSADEPDWIGQVTSLEVSKGHAIVRFGEAPREVVRFGGKSKQEPKDSAPICASLKDRGVSIGDWSALSVAQAALGLPPPTKPK